MMVKKWQEQLEKRFVWFARFLIRIKRSLLSLRWYKQVLLVIGLLGIVYWWFCLPNVLFDKPLATVITDNQGILIGARIADDGQWRFPELDSVPSKVETCVLLFEDEYFYKHPGINPVALVKAVKHNITQDSRIGGSTITQQMIRLSRNNPPRNYFQKFIEVLWATRAEFRFTKEDLLIKYLSHAPFGGNVVGLETASWRYFGVPSHQLSWGQAAALAVLPNAPSLIFPGKNQDRLRLKRDGLLKKLFLKKIIDATTYELSLEEPLPDKPIVLPNLAPHLTQWMVKNHKGQKIETTIDLTLQLKVNAIAQKYHYQYASNQIDNLAILVLDIEKNKVLSYVGNSPVPTVEAYHVDLIQSKRSTGSVLKPFLYANLLDEGLILPHSLVADVPTIINGYQPKNFDKTYSGLVPADKALAKSLNVPSVRLLSDLGLPKFYRKLHKIGLKTIDKPPNHYGLSLILGGAESNLWELTNAYAGLARTLNEFINISSSYSKNAFKTADYCTKNTLNNAPMRQGKMVFGAGAVYKTLEALREVNRPEVDENWMFFNNSQPMAWKTGTSYGFKDAWAIGVTPKYAIGVWVGNADGEGRPGITGLTAAAPVLFDVLDRLPASGWFKVPYDDLLQKEVCAISGFLAGNYCDEVYNNWIPIKGTNLEQCPYHKPFFVDESEHFRVNADCYPRESMKLKNYFALPPRFAHYYKQKNPSYQSVPPYLSGCNEELTTTMAFIYPKTGEVLMMPKNWGGTREEVSFIVTHQREEAQLFWYIDEVFIGTTQGLHELSYHLKPGMYLVTVVDDKGFKINQTVTVSIPD